MHYVLFDAFVCSKQCSTYIRIIFFLITVQEKIDPVTVGVENVGEEDGIETKSEQHYIQQLVRTIKTEQEVSFILACFVVRRIFVVRGR